MMSLIRIIENTFFANCRFWGGLNSSLYQSGSIRAMKTGIASADLNMVWNEKPLTADDGKTIQGIKTHFRKAGLPFWWWVFPCGQSPATRNLLQAEGFLPVESIPSLLVDLTSLPDASSGNAALQITRVKSKENLRLWEEVSFHGFDFPTETKMQYHRFLDAMDLTDQSEQKLFLASWKGKPAATSLLFLHEEAGGIYFVSTRPEYRTKGIGLAVTLATMRAIKQAGARYATLQSSPDGLRIYQQAGFTEYCRADVYGLAENRPLE
jgi:GNAT superfamily N-acetyltransferase